MNRKELARMLEYAADLMEVLGEGEMRASAYRKAARNVEKLEADLEDLARHGFKGVAGVGVSLAPMLTEIVQSGEFGYLGELEARIPPGVLELFRVQGLGPKRIRAMWENGFGSLEELIRAAEAGKIRTLPGFGEKSEASLLEAARFALEGVRRVLLPVGIEASQLILQDLAAAGIRAEVAGSIRRGLETIGNVDMVAVGEPQAVAKALGNNAESLEGNVVLGKLEGLPLRVFCATEGNFGSRLFEATGSKEWLSTVQALALSSQPSALSSQPTEEAVFAGLGQPYIPPYWREPEHIGLEVPSNVLKPEHLIGMIHNHTTASDGTGTLRQMAERTRELGYKYLVICDHSRSAPYAGGLEIERVVQQWADIEELNAELAPFRILKGIESDILSDGSLDYPEEVLKGFDVIVGSLHSGFNLSRHDQTQRLLRAMDNPYLTILAHPTARLLLRRKSVDADWDAVLSRAAERGVLIEFNCNPYRLDLDWRLLLKWRDRINVSISPDAHSVEGLEMMHYGVLFAAKAGLPPEQIANTWSAERLIGGKRKEEGGR